MKTKLTHFQKQNLLIAGGIILFALLVSWVSKTFALDTDLIKYIVGFSTGGVAFLGVNASKDDD